jgi:hypothetical protein
LESALPVVYHWQPRLLFIHNGIFHCINSIVYLFLTTILVSCGGFSSLSDLLFTLLRFIFVNLRYEQTNLPNVIFETTSSPSFTIYLTICQFLAAFPLVLCFLLSSSRSLYSFFLEAFPSPHLISIHRYPPAWHVKKIMQH